MRSTRLSYNKKCLPFATAWKNNAMGKSKPWSRTKGEQKIWNRRPDSQRYRDLEEDDEQNNVIGIGGNGMKNYIT